ncbi:P-loop NTPase [Marinomonas shanghaiensis]|uniref:P-loop NTPase n=1 Tax=Marinomonas shanghaiensis TaxID=2202418 RepID=UPI000DB90B13|nr:hypothetical protein [Marinomonas shanghaiensis]
MEIEAIYEELHEAVKEQCAASEFHLKKKLSGKSGDSVYLCDITISSPPYSGFAIIKYSTSRPDYSKNEYGSHQLAVGALPEFAAQHIPKLIKKVNSNNKSAFIMSIAGSGLGLTEELASLTHDTQTKTMCLVSNLLLDQWHTGGIAEECSAQTVLSNWLDYRISDQSTLPNLLQNVLSVSPQVESFYLANRSFSNPYYYAKCGDLPLSGMKLRPLEGYMHGDLHGHNCLYGGHNKRKQSVFLIDLEQFKAQMPLFFDQAYLEFSLLLNNHAEVSVQEWTSVIDLLSDIEECEESDVIDLNGEMYARVRQIQTFRKSIRTWATEHYDHRIEDVYTQLMLARVAVGLNFANKGRLADVEAQSNKMKVFAFLYAAENLNYLLKFKKQDVREPQVIAKPTFFTAIKDEGAIKTIWSECDYFNRHKAKYALLAGDELSRLSARDSELLSSLPWNLVFDFDTRRDGILGRSQQRLSENTAWKHYFPEQIEKELETDILIWLSVNGHQLDSSSMYSSFRDWRRAVIKKLRVLSEEFARHTSVLPVNLVVIAGEEDANKVEHIIQVLDESLGDKLKVIVICSDEAEQQAYQELGEKLGLDDITCLQCKAPSFVRSISQYYSLPTQGDKVLIPMANTCSNEPLKIEVPKEVYAASSKCVTILHPGLVEEKTDIGQFHKGHQISWAELEQSLAIDMSIDSEVERQAVAALKKNSYEKCTIYHQPGTGGSTVIRKVAWRLKDDWPVLMVTRNSTNIHEYVEKISNLTNLPILIVVDGSILNSTEKDKLVNELKIRGVNHLLLESERGLHTSKNKHSSVLTVPCPLESKDANIFYGCYKELSAQSRHSALKALTFETSMLEYRQPFFYGFFTFEEEFRSVESFVVNSIKELSEDRKQLLLWVSLITRYSQEILPITFLNVMLGKESTSVFRIKEEFGPSAAPLFLVQNRSVRVIHPVIAEQLIIKLLGKNESLDYPGKLQDACIKLVDSLGSTRLRNEDKTGQILQGLFISRQSGGNQDNVGKARFSELLKEIDSTNKQHNVLKHLCDIFSEEAHYLSHFGRHINYDDDRNSAEAIPYFEEAIGLDPESEVHYHGLAMVYSNLVHTTIRDIRNNRLSQQGTRIRATDVIERISDNYESSKEYFKRAYHLSWKSEHALVSYTKLIQKAVEAIYLQSKPVDAANSEYKYCDFLTQNNTASRWCREALEEMEWAVAELKYLQAENEVSHHAEKTISTVPRFYDDKASLIEGLSSLIASHNDIDHSNTRRLLASTYFKVHEELELSTKKLNKVVELMESNITGSSGDDRDIKYWFRAYRMLPSFSYSEAIDKIETWERLRKSIQASYYLYILHYFSYEQGVLTSQQKAKDYIEKCKRNMPISTTSKKSFEWVSSDMKKALQLVNSNELGKWDGFFEYTKKLGRVKGMILSVENHVKGTIRINGFEAFFVPKSEFTTDDVNTEVSFYLGFSFEGLRAWKVEKTKG